MTTTTTPKPKSVKAKKVSTKVTHQQIVQNAGTDGHVLHTAPPAPMWPTHRVQPALSFVVYGHPTPQGSHHIEYRRGKPMTVDNAENLENWRNSIRSVSHKAIAAYEKKTGKTWQPMAEPVLVQAIITFPHSQRSKKDGDIFYTNTPDQDKLHRAIGDALSPPKVKYPAKATAEVKAQIKKQNQKRAVAIDDSYFYWDQGCKIYESAAPYALEYPGVLIQAWRLQDLELYKSIPIKQTGSGKLFSHASDLRSWGYPANGMTWEEAFSATSFSSVPEDAPVKVTMQGAVSADSLNSLAYHLVARGPDALVPVEIVQ